MDDKEARKLFVLAKTELKMPEMQLKALIGPVYSKFITDQSIAAEITGYQAKQCREEHSVKEKRHELTVKALALREKVVARLSEVFDHMTEKSPGVYAAQVGALTKMFELLHKSELGYLGQAGKNAADSESNITETRVIIKKTRELPKKGE